MYPLETFSETTQKELIAWKDAEFQKYKAEIRTWIRKNYRFVDGKSIINKESLIKYLNNYQ